MIWQAGSLKEPTINLAARSHRGMRALGDRSYSEVLS